jgi:hypothetical protein
MQWSRWNASISSKTSRKPSGGKAEFDQMREVPFVLKADDLALATNHLAQSSSASRFTAGAAEFFFLSQSGERPER